MKLAPGTWTEHTCRHVCVLSAAGSADEILKEWNVTGKKKVSVSKPVFKNESTAFIILLSNAFYFDASSR